MPDNSTSRRRFGGALAAATLAATLPTAAAAHKPAARPMKRTLIKPPRLREGDLIGVIAPGGYTSDTSIEKSVSKIESLGFRVRLGANLREVHGNYAGSVIQRLTDLHAMFADPEVKAIWCIRGGSGCISLLAGLDYALVRANPKILLGYSDITALHLAIFRRAGLVTFHGPVASSSQSDYSTAHMLAVLMDPLPTYTIPMAMENQRRARAEPHYAIRTVQGGKATGALMGGNLSMVSALAGTPYAADFRHSILFLEDVNEAPYRIDRWMTQLDLSVGLANAAGVMIGICDKCGPGDEPNSLTLDETLDIHLKPLTIPAVTGYSFGHIRHQFTMPMGIRATLDTERQTLTLLEAAVT
ncbi:LD-carboxypeptidase [Massilia eurypsychrophila]|uniref:LD-carboxypeptidase n=1 Tax=Massilia eurypsychrophila TaxID=1485217 RepID=A0A2G8TL21_9BURK|nr:LD-carboxypeptidase [Massilia eurypsychrophila]PIL46750.1 LD-carboxypeptidase [Massilia eurypsychrophila]